ncbi:MULTISPECIES: tyrosine-type recombinase/integrase [Bacillaceae]|uniref:tyrosine-type recombinase/integrase n=1 Tax=Bacillaceae TaxID=186817 RepID=UPI00203FECF8|nr:MULTISPECIES: tyrosine-type recombinase/integrase [Bacillaceae]MCM3032941.1 site-specific integrase [Niallia sp. MER 6]MCM3572493.1 site-specific integrase [Mesobacillus subterraneus]
MRVQEVILEGLSKRYMLIDQHGCPVLPVMKYLKYLDITEKSSNTQKTYCYALKHYFVFLHDNNKDYKAVCLDDLVEFIGWLRNPYQNIKVSPIQPKKSKKTEKTINLTITVILNFYDYLYRNNTISSNMVDPAFKQVFSGGRNKFKDFLFHVNKGKPVNRNILKLKEPKQRLSVLVKDEVLQLIEATKNIRDKLLIQLLFETGLRIGEVLSLFLEDFVFDHIKGHRIRLVDRGELENGAKLKTGEREIYVSQELMDLYDDYLYEVLDELELHSNFVFIKIRGASVGKPMNYQDVSSLFKRLRKKTGIFKIHPHLLRHTHATMFYKQTNDLKQVQERLGHAHIQTTANLYLHPSEDEIRENWEKAKSSFIIQSTEA